MQEHLGSGWSSLSAEPGQGARVPQIEHKSPGNADPGPVEPLAGLGQG